MAAEPVPKTIFDAFAGHSAATAMPCGGVRQAEPQQLSAAAHALAEAPYEPAYSPIVLAGLVRMIEASLIVAVGLVLYIFYAESGYGFAWSSLAVILGIALLAMLAFQVADIYQVQAFRGREKQYMRLASAWSVVLLIAIGISFFANSRRPVVPRVAWQLLFPRPDHPYNVASDSFPVGAHMDA